MKTESIKHPKALWPKRRMRKWLSLKRGGDEFDSDFTMNAMADRSERSNSCSDDGRYAVVPEELSERWLTETNDDVGRLKPEKVDLSMFVGTWNVGGKSPHKGLDVRDWLGTSSPADIYVIGFQEIVPLNAGNVLGAESKSPAAKWLALIRESLNRDRTDRDPPVEPQHRSTVKTRASFSDLLSLQDELDQQEFQTLFAQSSSDVGNYDSSSGFCLAVSKQMVGIFLCVFIRKDLYRHISHLKVSCVGRGIMGYLGNKGSVSISMTLHQTTFCFVCTHLASGEKEGDECKRNSDVIEILKKTRFSPSFRALGKPVPPNHILDHNKIIWLGDLNYRLSSPSRDMHELVQSNNWEPLLEKDQLRIEQRAGRVFEGWEEGRIYFAPTYKYRANSDNYVAQTSTPKEKRRTPAWCDRILWKGDGLKQMSYVRGESKFSDHRPVYSLFSVQVNLPSNENTTVGRRTLRNVQNAPKSLSSSISLAQELFLNKTKSCMESIPRFVPIVKKITNQ